MNFIIAIKQYFLFFSNLIRYEPDIVYLPNAQTTIAYFRDIPFIILTKVFREKIVGHLRGVNFRNWLYSTSMLTKYIAKKVHPHFDAQIVLGKNLISMYQDICDLNKVPVVLNVKDMNIQPIFPKSEKEKTQLLFLANFHESKGIIDTIKSVSLLTK